MKSWSKKLSRFFNRKIRLDSVWTESIAALSCILGFCGFLRGLVKMSSQVESAQRWFFDAIDPTGIIGFIIGTPVFIISAMICLECDADDKAQEHHNPN